jgi:hypothetical protein
MHGIGQLNVPVILIRFIYLCSIRRLVVNTPHIDLI